MKRMLLSLLAVALFFGVGLAQAADPMSDKEASPTIGERITKDAVKGTLMKGDGEYYTIKDNDGKETKIHVDKSTKMDKVGVGDHVKAYVTEDGYASTIQRVVD